MNMDCKILINLTLLTAFVCQAVGKLIVKPRDTDVKVNHATYFNCSTDYGSTAIFWYHGTKYVYTGTAILEPYHERFQINRNIWNGTYIYNLIIHSVQPEDAGQYKCAEDEGVGEEYSVQLVVLEDDPICRSNIELNEVIGQNTCNIEPDEVELECSVTYHGNIPPQMEWKKVGENSFTPLEVSVVTSRNHFVSTLKLKGDIALNNSSYVCETKRTTQEPIKCTSKVINILYAVGLIGNSTTNRTINDEIHCSANTSQSCSYKWKWLQDNDFTIESSTSVLKARKPGWHRCEAECYLRNRSCNLLVMRAMVYGETVSSPTSTIIISAVVSVAVTLIVVGVLIFVFLWITKRRDRSGNPDEGHELPEGRHSDELAEKCKTFPVLIATIKTTAAKAGSNSINGMTILDKELFVVSGESSEAEVYDSVKLSFIRQWNLRELIYPMDIASCNRNKCLYIFDGKGSFQSNKILRVDPSGNLIKQWPTGDDWGHGLSVTDESNIILSVYKKNKLNEYSSNGQLIREIDLSSDAGIRSPWHAIKLTNGNFVVSHGSHDVGMHRVCIVNADGKLKKAFGGKRGSSIAQMNRPIYLAVDRNGFIFVVDQLNCRVLLLDSDLKFNREILWKEKHKSRFPQRILLDESNGIMLITDNNKHRPKDGRILVFNN